MRFSQLPLAWKIGSLAIFVVLFGLWVAAWVGVINWLPPAIASHLGIAAGAFAIGFVMGDNHGAGRPMADPGWWKPWVIPGALVAYVTIVTVLSGS
jgi:hypothetical protein